MLAGKELFTRPALNKTSEAIASEWDRIAHARHMQIATGKDLSFNYVLKPTVLELLQGCNLKRVLDLGSGTGELTRPCRQNNLVQMTIARIWQIARKDAAFLA